MTTRAPAASLQRRRIHRWVAAVGLLATAEDLRGADVPETNAMGLMGAHAACEAMLGLIVGPLPFVKGQPPNERFFPDLLGLTASVAKPRLSQALRGELMAMHEVRNAFVHGGSTVDAAELDRAIDAAHALAEHVPLPGHQRLVGVPTVVADIIDIEAIGMWLRHADHQRTQGHLRLSADGIARALDAAIDRTVPPVRTRTGLSMEQTLRELRGLGAGLGFERTTRETVSAIDQLTRWVYPMALGTPPATLAYIRSVVGADGGADLGGHPGPVHRPADDEPSVADLRRASSLVGRIILRLWAMDGLAAGRADAEIVALAQEFLGKPFGHRGTPAGREIPVGDRNRHTEHPGLGAVRAASVSPAVVEERPPDRVDGFGKGTRDFRVHEQDVDGVFVSRDLVGTRAPLITRCRCSGSSTWPRRQWAPSWSAVASCPASDCDDLMVVNGCDGFDPHSAEGTVTPSTSSSNMSVTSASGSPLAARTSTARWSSHPMPRTRVDLSTPAQSSVERVVRYARSGPGDPTTSPPSPPNRAAKTGCNSSGGIATRPIRS